MPIYEYLCTNCGARFEKIQKISEPKLNCCPECQQQNLQKIISATAFRLKGQGWYETDFKTSKEAKKNLAIDDNSVSTQLDKPNDTVKPGPSDNTNQNSSSKENHNGGA